MTRLHPIIVVTVIGAIAAFCILRVQFSATLYEMLPADLPEVQGMDRLNRYFSRDGQLIVTVKAEESYLAEEALMSLSAKMEETPELISEVFRELSLTELVTEGGGLLAWLWMNGSSENLAELGSRLSAEGSPLAIGEAMASLQSGFFDQDVIVTSYDPLGFSKIGGLMDGDAGEASGPDPMTSTDGTFQVMYVEGAGVDFSNYRDAEVWLEKVKAFVREWEQEWIATQGEEAAIEIGLTGTPAFMAEVGTEMEKDMTISVVVTMLLISLLFWIMHRRTRPLSWLVSAMLAILAITILIGGVLFGDLSVMSAGFAAILMGLAVDYGIVLYREAMDSGGDAKALRRSVGPGILWAAATTAVVFLSLNLSSLPGLAEMGNLVAMGVVVGALVMLYGFGPVAVSFNRGVVKKPAVDQSRKDLTRVWAGVLAILVPLGAIVSMAMKEMPHLEANFHPFRIRESPSMVAWQQLQSELAGRENAVPTVITGDSIEALNEELDAAAERIESAKEAELLTQYVLPTAFIPLPKQQLENIETIRSLLNEKTRLISELNEAGFSEEGTRLTQTVFDAWSNYTDQLAEGELVLPTGKLAEWSIDRLFAEEEGVYAALATVKPSSPRDREWVAAVCSPNTVVASLGSLGTALNERIGQDILRVFLPMMGLLSIMLGVVFRHWKDLLLSLFSLVFTGCIIVLLTVWTPMSWNSFNICGLPLLFGTGLDFSIHMIFALRRSGGDVGVARAGIGKALVFCGTSSAIGFGSLASASAYGLASLGVVCAIGILANMVVAVWLLPRWYRCLHRLSS
ncbi:MAG: MMPL family transporter [Verrucomicrobiales bacterium]|nr:MMPL family transporter [Verrucomicrobiales bacterium]